MSSMEAVPAAQGQRRRDAAKQTEWWRGATIYQIYPRSFLDSNGDGVGDLNGVIDRLDYVASLNVDGVWLSPFFTSPMKDFGYDVADYCDVDPIFGALSDFERLVDEAHQRDLKIVIDQVYSHTSDRHAWFQESRQSRTNAKADWYVWADAKPEGSPPCNWQSVFGGPAWTWDSRRGQYYMHNFLTSQPDLNLHNPAVQDALLDVARFWLDRGVDGFRLDAINFGMHDPAFRDNPPAPRDGRKITRPFDLQEHVYNQSHPDIPKFLERIRAVLDEYGAIFTVAEIGGPTPLGEMKEFTAGDARLNSAYSFDFLYAEKITKNATQASLSAWSGDDSEGWPSWAFSNHDAPRAVSRWSDRFDRDQIAKLNILLLSSLRGNIFIYQGEELGLIQADVPFEKLQDPEAIANWPQTLGRDGARTPMPWRDDAPYAGFSTAEPWLPVDPRHLAQAVDRQQQSPGSVLNFARACIDYRRTSNALRIGDCRFLSGPKDVLVFTRRFQGETLLCAFNLGDSDATYSPPANEAYKTVFTVGLSSVDMTPPVLLPPRSGYMASRAS